jgi:CBS domain-containing protein
MKNTIVRRVADFLKGYLPFSLLAEEELLELARSISVIYKEKGETFFRPGETILPEIFVLREGGVHLRRSKQAECVFSYNALFLKTTMFYFLTYII